MKKILLFIFCAALLSFITCSCTTKNKVIAEETLKAEDLVILDENGKFGIANKNGEIVVEPIYDYISEFHDDLCAFFIQDISDNVKIGYFNTKGDVAIEPTRRCTVKFRLFIRL